MRRVILLLTVMATTLVVASGVALAQAETFTFTQKYPLFGQITNTCSRENVQFNEGYRITTFHVTDTGNGQFVVVVRNTFQGVTGIGLVTGNEYKFVGSNTESVTVHGGSTFTLTATGKLISADGTPDQLGKTIIHVTVNNNGEPTTVVEGFKFECTGPPST